MTIIGSRCALWLRPTVRSDPLYLKPTDKYASYQQHGADTFLWLLETTDRFKQCEARASCPFRAWIAPFVARTLQFVTAT